MSASNVLLRISMPPTIRCRRHCLPPVDILCPSLPSASPDTRSAIRAARRRVGGPWSRGRRDYQAPAGRRTIGASDAVERSKPLVEPAGKQPLLPSLRLDELLDELQVRLQAVLSTRDRVYSLLEAVVAVGSSLDLEVLLRSIVETAVSLVDAEYGAMGVIGEGGGLAEFIPVGLTAEQIAAIHHWPEGKGLLGLLVTDPKPLRISDISEHPGSFG